MFPPPASRNAPCPCGSGRRYKECHGAIAGAQAPDAALVAQLQQALAAQQAGRVDEAIAGYTAALARAPDHFDALHMLGVSQFQRGDFDAALATIDRALAVRPDDPGARFNRQLVANAIARRPAERELARDAQAFARRAANAHTGDDRAVRVVAFYLPQYHRIPENDAWWGEGFTEWTNVRRAKPNFDGHAQPHVPGELGYYDLTDPDVREAQASLAREYGVDAFCYYHYWFGGRRLLERPLDEVLASGRPDFPFCICWANENWTRRWDGLDHEILMAQRYSPEDARAFIESVLPALRDRRYVRVDGRPLLLVYKVAEIPGVAAMVELWRDVCRDAGVGELYLAAVQRHSLDDPTPLGFDASVEFPPIGHAAESIEGTLTNRDPQFRGSVYGYANLAADYLLRPRPAFRTFRGVTPMWDNTPRRQRDGMIVHGSTPGLFGAWAARALQSTRLRHCGEERLLFVNAWNEWGEGNHLEPDAKHGRAYLEALRDARRIAASPLPERPSLETIERDTQARLAEGSLIVERFGPRAGEGHASVVMPVYNHERYLPRALASLLAQSMPPGEVVAVDDGSSDRSVDVLRDFASRAPFPVTIARQGNAGAHAALNAGLALATGDRIALLNSDDAFAPDRLARLVAAIDDEHGIAFSAVSVVDDDDAPASGPYASELVARVAEMRTVAERLAVLVRHNPAISTGNLVFRRTLLKSTGGFAAFRVCHDWDFLLAATFATHIAFVDAPLYAYRLHASNTFASATLDGRFESEVILSRFFSRLHEHPGLDADGRERLVAFARGHGLAGFL